MAERAVVTALTAVLVHEGARLAGTDVMARRATRWQLCRVDIDTISKPWGRGCNSTFTRRFRISGACTAAMERIRFRTAICLMFERLNDHGLQAPGRRSRSFKSRRKRNACWATPIRRLLKLRVHLQGLSRTVAEAVLLYSSSFSSTCWNQGVCATNTGDGHRVSVATAASVSVHGRNTLCRERSEKISRARANKISWQNR